MWRRSQSWGAKGRDSATPEGLQDFDATLDREVIEQMVLEFL